MRISVILLLCLSVANAAVYHVSAAANDQGEGTAASPWKTVQRAADAIKAGDTVIIHAGTYRERVQVKTSGAEAAPIIFAAAKGERPVLSGSEPLEGPWKDHGHGLFSCLPPGKREVPGWLFIDGAHAVQALLYRPVDPGTFTLGLLGPRWENPPIGPDVRPDSADRTPGGEWWEPVKAAAGTLDLDTIFHGKQKDSLVFLHTYIFSPSEIRGSLRFPGASRQSGAGNSFYGMYRIGSSLAVQPQFMKVWVNGLEATEWNGGSGLYGAGLNLKKGWNSLLVMLFADQQGPWRVQVGVTANRGGGLSPIKLFSQAARPADFTTVPADNASNGLVPDVIALPWDAARPGDPGRLPVIGEWLVAGPYPDRADGRLYVRLPQGDSPRKHQMEWGSRDAVFSIGRDAQHIQLQDLTVRHAASRAQGSAIELGPHSVVERCTVEENLGNGIRIASYCTIRDSMLRRNGCTGTSGGRVTDIQVLNSDLIGNNWMHYDIDWHAGGLKFLFVTNVVVRGNRVIDNEAVGIWLDTGIYNSRIENNLCRNNRSSGIFLEISRGKNVIANNICVNTRASWTPSPRGDGIYMHDTSDALIAHNLCSANSRFGISTQLVTDRIMDGGGLCECSRNAILNNVCVGNGVGSLRRPAEQPRQTGNRSDYNVLAPAEKDGSIGQAILSRRDTPFLGFDLWNKLGFDQHSIAAIAPFRKGNQSEFLPADGSPAVGLCPLLEDVPTDFDGKPRRMRTTAGPFEYAEPQ
jgi:parallel beta-helix repeat protein